ncbi:MAG: S41 family peptidase [Myxococcota bacterium]
MIDPRRYSLAIAQCAIILALFFVYDFDERGHRFGAIEATAKIDRSGIYDLGRARILTKVIGHVRSHYVDPSRVTPRAMLLASVRAVQQRVPEVIVTPGPGKRPAWVEITVDQTTERFGLTRVRDLYEFNWKLMDVFAFLQRELPPNTDLESIEYAAVNGALETLDPHSVMLDPEIYREMQLGTHGRFGGLGIRISIREGALTIMSLMDDTPAARAGLKSGDEIAQIGEESTINMPLNDAVNRLRGAPGSEVTIWIKRKGLGALKPYKVIREEIRIRSVDERDLGEGVGYVRIRNFQGNTFDDLNSALSALAEGPEGLKGIVLDLRENPGGLLDQAIKVSDRFLSHGTIVTTVRERGRAREERHATHANTLGDLPIVVLLNRGSASASEIVAGALKHNGRALVLGSTSFGKGSVQVVYRIDDAALKLTIAQYLTPGDISIQSVGIVPDVAIQPVRITRDLIDLYPDELDARGEADLESHLENKKTRRMKPIRRLRLLQPEAEEETKEDAQVTLAKALILAGPRPDRQGMLVAATGFLDRRENEESSAIGEKLATLDVDWSMGPNPSKPKLMTSITVVREGEAGPLRAGDTIRITAQVKGDPSRALWRLHGLIRSEIHALDGREVVFGHVPAKGTKTWSTTMTLPRSLSHQADRLEIDLFADGKPLKSKGHLDIEIAELPQPLFAYDVSISDDDGNGDGLIQRGERVTLSVHVTNVGEGAAESTLMTIKNESGEAVYIEKGRHKGGALKPGETHTAKFMLKVKESLTSQDIQLKVGMADLKLRTWIRDDLTLPVFPAAYPVAERVAQTVAVSGGAVQVHAGPHRDTQPVALLSRDTVLRSLAKAGDWLQVALTESPAQDGEPWTGWVPANNVATSSEALKTDTVTRLYSHEPPAVEFDPAALDTLLTTGKSWTLAGSARFAGSGEDRRYVVIFRDDDKVFFRSARPDAAERSELPFSADIPLNPGRNIIRVVAREGEDDVTGRTVIVYRR